MCYMFYKDTLCYLAFLGWMLMSFHSLRNIIVLQKSHRIILNIVAFAIFALVFCIFYGIFQYHYELNIRFKLDHCTSFVEIAKKNIAFCEHILVERIFGDRLFLLRKLDVIALFVKVDCRFKCNTAHRRALVADDPGNGEITVGHGIFEFAHRIAVNEKYRYHERNESERFDQRVIRRHDGGYKKYRKSNDCTGQNKQSCLRNVSFGLANIQNNHHFNLNL